jgi:ribA/ribD-fused uncharacterized protein
MVTRLKKQTNVSLPVVNEITITRVALPSGWLSCMSAYPVQYNGQTYKTCEALFQCLRFEGHPAVQDEIRNCPSPMGAKMIARRERARLNRQGNWDQDASDLPRMRMCLQLKLEQHPDLQQRLRDTGDAVIIEDCTSHDRESARFWGQVRIDDEWVGDNHLGRIWMELRDELNNQ